MPRMKARIFFLAACVAAALAVHLSAQPALDRQLAGKIDALVSEEFAKDGVGGVTVAVVKGNAVAWAKGYGLADIEARTPASANTVYRIGSITKPFTAVMLLQLAERGVVKLSDPVEKYLPEVNRVKGRPEGTAPITLEQLATMRAGIDREPGDLDTFLVGSVDKWEQVLFEALARTKYDHEPGTSFLYSNIGYAILGATLGRAAKKPYIEYVRESVLRPLGMRTTDFIPTAAIQPELAKGYEIRNGKPDGEQAAREHAGRGYKVPNGALYTTVGDLAKFVGLWLGEGPETVLKRATIDDAFTRAASTPPYGTGFMVQKGTHPYFGHGGSVAGYRAQMIYHRPSKTGVLVFRNVGGGPFNGVAVAEKVLTLAVDR